MWSYAIVNDTEAENRTWTDWDSNPGPLAYCLSPLPAKLPSHMVDRLISLCWIRFVTKSAQNHTGTDETVSFLLAVRAWDPILIHQMRRGGVKRTWPDHDYDLNLQTLPFYASTLSAVLPSHMVDLFMNTVHNVSYKSSVSTWLL